MTKFPTSLEMLAGSSPVQPYVAPGEFSSVDPAAHLPALSRVANLDMEERRAALAHWVSWFNGHRSMVPHDLEKQLDRALQAFDRDETSQSQQELERLQSDFDDWLESLPST